MSNERTAEPSPHAGPIPDSYWAAAGALLAGPLPRADDRPALRAKVKALLDAGIRTVIDLRTPAEEPGIRVLFEKLAPSDTAVVWINVPILNGAAPNPAELDTILDAIDASVARDRPVYVHCQGGLGRTGTVVAAYWIRRREYDLAGALDALARRRVGQPNGDRPSPESPAQHRCLKLLAGS
ncbi:MAG: dual specificity protein phosphatase family protein [Sandaracinaceae bacterium]